MDLSDKSLKIINKELNNIVNTSKSIIVNGSTSEILEMSNFLEKLKISMKFYDTLIKNLAFELAVDIVEEDEFHFIEKTNTGIMVTKLFEPVNLNEKKETEKEKEKEIEIEVPRKIIIKKLYDIDIPKTSFTVSKKLNTLSPVITYYEGDCKNKAGLYACIGEKIIVKVPLSSTSDITNRLYNIRCRNETRVECDNIHKKNSDARICSFIHKGEKYIKMPSTMKCQGMPSFGKLDTLERDIKNIDIRDIKTIIFYAISDLLLIHIWASNTPHNSIIFDNIDVFT